jgi:hypothetical protein
MIHVLSHILSFSVAFIMTNINTNNLQKNVTVECMQVDITIVGGKGMSTVHYNTN